MPSFNLKTRSNMIIKWLCKYLYIGLLLYLKCKFSKVLSVTAKSLHIDEDSFIISTEKNSDDHIEIKCSGYFISIQRESHKLRMQARIEKDIIFYLISFIKIDFD